MNTDVSFNCPECGHRIEDGIIEMVFELRNTHVAVSNVPAKVCPNCGQELHFSHTYDSASQKMVESVICQQCRHGQSREHLLH